MIPQKILNPIFLFVTPEENPGILPFQGVFSLSVVFLYKLLLFAPRCRLVWPFKSDCRLSIYIPFIFNNIKYYLHRGADNNNEWGD